MDFVNKTIAQAAELFKSLTPAARVMAGFLAALVLISLAYLFQSQTSGPDAYLMGGEPFSASQLPAMEAAFSKANLNDYVIEGNRVRVPQGQQAAYMGALAEAGALPASFGTYLGKAVSSNSPWISKDQQRELIKVAKQNELQDIIAAMNGIERASVLYDVQDQRSFGAQTLITASVSVKPNGVLPLDEERVPTLRHLVASAIAGLKPENVTIIDLNGKHYPGGGSGGPGMAGAGGENVYGAWKKAYEQEWQNKIRYALAYIPGVVVTPNVELDIETAHEENVTTYDPKTVAYNVKESSTNKLVKGAGPGGRPGVVAQQGGANQPAAISQSSGSETNEESSETQTSTAVPGKVVRTVQHGLTPKRVTVSVSVPSTYYERVWAERNPPAEGQPVKKPDAQALLDIETKVKTDIEGAVVALLPAVPPTTDPYPRVKVSTFQPVLAPATPGPTTADLGLAWLSRHWTTLGMICVAAASLLMLRSLIRSLPSASAAGVAGANASEGGPTLSLVAGDETAPANSDANTARNRLKRRGVGGPSLRDELAEIVKEDPDTAVAILRNWIGAAG